jgi:hypothetical protein
MSLTTVGANRVGFGSDNQKRYVSSIYLAGNLEMPLVRALTLVVDTSSTIAESRLTRNFTDGEYRSYRIDSCSSEME